MLRTKGISQYWAKLCALCVAKEVGFDSFIIQGHWYCCKTLSSLNKDAAEKQDLENLFISTDGQFSEVREARRNVKCAKEKLDLLINFYHKQLDKRNLEFTSVSETTHLIEDAAGQEDCSRLRPLNYRGAMRIVLGFSIISRASYENVLKKWMPEHRHFAPNVPIVVVGTKLDLREDRGYVADHMGYDVITSSQGEELRKQIGAAAYIECSSKT